MNRIFVYGSLLSGMGNSHFLENSQKLGDDITPNGFSLVDLGYFPGALKANYGIIKGEVYEVDDNTFKRINQLEGYNEANPTKGLYNRIEIDTTFGKAFMYIYNNVYNSNDFTFVEDGDWRTYYNKYKVRHEAFR